MTRTLIVILTVLLFGFALCWAAESAIVGKWDCSATDDAGQQSNWTLVVTDEGGKLAGTLTGDPGEFALVDPKMEGDSFTFKVIVNDVTYTGEVTIDGKTMTGKYHGAEASGTIKGTKQD
jgi:hypothetical protein